MGMLLSPGPPARRRRQRRRTAGGEIETGHLTVWGAEEDEALLQEILLLLPGPAMPGGQLSHYISAQSESSCKDAMLGDWRGARRVRLRRRPGVRPGRRRRAGPHSKTRRRSAPPGLPRRWTPPAWAALSTSIPLDGRTTAIFSTTTRTYLLRGDVQEAWTGCWRPPAEPDGLVSMDLSSACYVYSFFGNTGPGDRSERVRPTNHCIWNSTRVPSPAWMWPQAMLSAGRQSGLFQRKKKRTHGVSWRAADGSSSRESAACGTRLAIQ